MVESFLGLEARRARALVRYNRAVAAIERSQRQILWSRVMTRCKISRIRGSSDDPSVVLARLRVLIEAEMLPRKPPATAFAGPTHDGHACIGCGGKLVRGEIEYELDIDSHVMYLHRRCFDIWREFDRQSA